MASLIKKEEEEKEMLEMLQAKEQVFVGNQVLSVMDKNSSQSVALLSKVSDPTKTFFLGNVAYVGEFLMTKCPDDDDDEDEDNRELEVDYDSAEDEWINNRRELPHSIKNANWLIVAVIFNDYDLFEHCVQNHPQMLLEKTSYGYPLAFMTGYGRVKMVARTLQKESQYITMNNCKEEFLYYEKALPVACAIRSSVFSFGNIKKRENLQLEEGSWELYHVAKQGAYISILDIFLKTFPTETCNEYDWQWENTPLHHCAFMGSDLTASMILEHCGADNKGKMKMIAGWENHNYFTPLDNAIEKGKFAFVLTVCYYLDSENRNMVAEIVLDKCKCKRIQTLRQKSTKKKINKKDKCLKCRFSKEDLLKHINEFKPKTYSRKFQNFGKTRERITPENQRVLAAQASSSQ